MIEFAANDVQLCSFDILSEGDVFRTSVGHGKNRWTYGLVVLSEKDDKLMVALDGEQAFTCWKLGSQFPVLRIVDAGRLVFQLDLDSASDDGGPLPGTLIVNAEGAFLTAPLLIHSMEHIRRFRIQDWKEGDATLAQGHYMVVRNWNLGYLGEADKFCALAKVRTGQ